jgi:diguanylate cyclase (GGDEF)-like protein
LGPPQLSDEIRRSVATLLADDRPVPAQLLDRLRGLRSAEDAPVCAAALQQLANLRLTERQAERLLIDLLAHRDQLARALKRDPGIRVAAIDYLSNVKKILVNPTIVERAQLDRTQRSAITDALTGLYNRRFFMSSLGLEVQRSRRYSLRLAILMLDLDEFKLLNDRHGHTFGDLVLQRVGRLLRRAVREADLACRYGGEEFAVILPETGRLGAFAVAERIRQRLDRGFAEPIGGQAVDVRLSGGIAAFPEDAGDPEGLVARADQALYLSKRHGKDRVSLHHAERRQAVRYPARAGARAGLRLAACGTRHCAHALNLSRAGALLEVGVDCPPEARIELSFDGRDAAGHPRTWSQAGRVVRIDGAPPAPCRVAVAFDDPLAEDCLNQHVVRHETLRVAGLGGS